VPTDEEEGLLSISYSVIRSSHLFKVFLLVFSIWSFVIVNLNGVFKVICYSCGANSFSTTRS
jgi:hypothetical protein